MPANLLDLPPLVAIVADDLTGALDAAAPFAALGFSTCVATGPSHLPDAIQSRAQIVGVSTDSRDLQPSIAAALVESVSEQLHEAGSLIAFKKIDSRLKGQLAAELPAALRGLGRHRALICPAIPDMGRVVVGGEVRGFGVPQPVPIGASVGAFIQHCDLIDASSEADLETCAGRVFDSRTDVLAVGARGLASSLARKLAFHHLPRRARGPPTRLPRPLILCTGSLDPITLSQLNVLHRYHEARGTRFLEAPNGRLQVREQPPSGEDIVCVLTRGEDQIPSTVAASNFVESVVPMVLGRRPRSVILTGGDTASAVLSALHIGLLTVEGEILPGLPYATTNCAFGRLIVVTKSGGFGKPDTLLKLLGTSVRDGSPAES